MAKMLLRVVYGLILILSFSRSEAQIPIGNSSTTSSFGVNLGVWPSLFWSLSGGTYASPLTKAGPSFQISRVESMSPAACGNNVVDNSCNAALSIFSVSVAGSGMQTSGLNILVQGSPSADVVGINAMGQVTNIGTGIGTGAYLEGRRDTTTGLQLGAEIRSNNQTAIPESYTFDTFKGGALWLSASGLANSAHGAALKNVGQQFDVGFAALQNSVASQTFRDDTSSVTSFMINGIHTNGVDLTGGTYSGAPILAPLATPSSSSAVCKQGSIEWDASFVYVCIATNTWKRATLATF